MMKMSLRCTCTGNNANYKLLNVVQKVNMITNNIYCIMYTYFNMGYQLKSVNKYT